MLAASWSGPLSTLTSQFRAVQVTYRPTDTTHSSLSLLHNGLTSAANRPTVSVMSVTPGDDRSLRLLQALQDQNQAVIDESFEAEDVRQWWVNNEVDLMKLHNPDVGNTTCLKYAVEFSDATTVRRLLLAGADVRAVYTCGCKLLTKACQSDVDASAKVRHLLQRDASLINEPDCTGTTPLAKAAASGKVDIIILLIEHGADVSKRNISVCDDSEVDRPALHYACEKGQLASIHALIVHGADVEAKDSEFERTSLLVAAEFGHADCVETLLVDFSASVNAVDKLGQTALHWACVKGHVSCISILVDNGADIEARTRRGWTPLHWAAWCGHCHCVNVLAKDYSASVNAADKNGVTALHRSSQQGHVSCIHALVALAADVDSSSDDTEQTPLGETAAVNNKPDCVKIPVNDYGASINVADKWGWTPLHNAACAGHIEAVRALTSYSHCDITIKASSWFVGTAIDIARRCKHEGIVRILEGRYKGIATIFF